MQILSFIIMWFTTIMGVCVTYLSYRQYKHWKELARELMGAIEKTEKIQSDLIKEGLSKRVFTN